MNLLLTLMLALPATDLDVALSHMVATTGPTYLDARARVVAFGEHTLTARVNAATWGTATWQADAAAAAALTWAERPEQCARVYALDGLEPSIYLARRRPGPEVGRELRRLRDMGPIFFEALTKSLHRVSSPSDFPEGYRDRAEQLIATEHAALRVGLLAALGRSGHPVARMALSRVVVDTRAPESERRAAAIALGEAGGDVAVLAGLATDAGLSRKLRAGAVIGIAKASRADARASLDALRSFLADPVLRRPAISGFAIAGSTWGGASETLRAEVARVLTRELDANPDNRDLIEALSVVTHP